MFPRQWSASFTKLPEVAKFIDRSSARGCDVWCGNEQRFSAAAKGTLSSSSLYYPCNVSDLELVHIP